MTCNCSLTPITGNYLKIKIFHLWLDFCSKCGGILLGRKIGVFLGVSLTYSCSFCLFSHPFLTTTLLWSWSPVASSAAAAVGSSLLPTSWPFQLLWQALLSFQVERPRVCKTKTTPLFDKYWQQD